MFHFPPYEAEIDGRPITKNIGLNSNYQFPSNKDSFLQKVTAPEVNPNDAASIKSSQDHHDIYAKAIPQSDNCKSYKIVNKKAICKSTQSSRQNVLL